MLLGTPSLVASDRVQALRLRLKCLTRPLFLPDFYVDVSPVLIVCLFTLLNHNYFLQLLPKFILGNPRLLHPGVLVHLLHTDPLPGIRM